MTGGEKFGAFIIVLLIMLAAVGVKAAIDHDNYVNEVFVVQCNKAGGTAVTSGDFNKCYQGDHLLYSDESK